jgi:hypothetical protein
MNAVVKDVMTAAPLASRPQPTCGLSLFGVRSPQCPTAARCAFNAARRVSLFRQCVVIAIFGKLHRQA